MSGYAALYDTPSKAGGFYTETIARGAFDDAIIVSDIKALLNHDENELLARYKAGRSDNTLSVKADDKGLYFSFTMPKTREGLIESIKRKDIDQNSFAFTIAEEDWEERKLDDGSIEKVRTIQKVDRLFDVSLVTYPFYEEASFEFEQRAYDAWKAAQAPSEEDEQRTITEEEIKERAARLRLATIQLSTLNF